MSGCGFLYSHYIKELAYARLLPDNRTCNADIIRQATETATWATVGEPLPIHRFFPRMPTCLDCAKPCAGFVEYFPDFVCDTATLQRQEKFIATISAALPFGNKPIIELLRRIISNRVFLWKARCKYIF